MKKAPSQFFDPDYSVEQNEVVQKLIDQAREEIKAGKGISHKEAMLQLKKVQDERNKVVAHLTEDLS